MSVWKRGKPNTPGILDILWGAFVLALPKKRLTQFVFPPELDGYVFESSLKKADHQECMAIAIYRKGERRYIAKSWQGRRRDLNYYFLIHEYLATDILTRPFQSYTGGSVAVPAAADCFTTHESLIVLFDFIEGETIESLPSTEQLALWEKAQVSLVWAGQQLTKAEQNIIGRRGIIFYILFAFVFVFLIMLRRPSASGLALQALYRLLKSASAILVQPLVLAHRDLTSNNLLLGTDGKVYILDFESLVFTIPGYDRAYLSVDPDSTIVSVLLKSSDTSVFLQYYILLHHILGSGEYLQVNERYLETLRKLVTQKSL